MIFNTWTFGAFAIVVLTTYWTIVPPRLRPHALVTFGIVFYAYAVPAYLALIAALGATTYGLARAMLVTERAWRRPYLTLGIVAIVGTLAFFKYAHFLDSIFGYVSGRAIVPLPHLIVPLAISFFTFEFVHVLVDVDLGKIRRVDPLDFAVFTMFFPTLVAGPIKRYESFAPQVRAIELPPPREAALCAYRIFLGLAKKTIVADSMNAFITPFSHPGIPFARVDYLIAALAYAIKIYFDFSAYSDIAIGLGGLLGLRIPENFDMPYRSANITEFWRRWHMSLSSWIRDYVFIPLGGSRRSPRITALNLFLAMALAGLWHGAAWTFVLWGLWHGAGLIAHRFWSTVVVTRTPFLRAGGTFVRALSIATTFSFVAVGWIVFASPSIRNAILVFYYIVT